MKRGIHPAGTTAAQAGCKIVQGNSLARPMLASKFVDWLVMHNAALPLIPDGLEVEGTPM
jgi:hypothetical protein